MDVERVCVGVRFVHVAGESVKGRGVSFKWMMVLPSRFELGG